MQFSRCKPYQAKDPVGVEVVRDAALSRILPRTTSPAIDRFAICRVETKGFEPLTPCLQGRCSPN